MLLPPLLPRGSFFASSAAIIASPLAREFLASAQCEKVRPTVRRLGRSRRTKSHCPANRGRIEREIGHSHIGCPQTYPYV